MDAVKKTLVEEVEEVEELEADEVTEGCCWPSGRDSHVRLRAVSWPSPEPERSEERPARGAVSRFFGTFVRL